MPPAEKTDILTEQLKSFFLKLPSFLKNTSKAIRKEIKAQGMSLNQFTTDNAKSLTGDCWESA